MEEQRQRQEEEARRAAAASAAEAGIVTPGTEGTRGGVCSSGATGCSVEAVLTGVGTGGSGS